MDKLLFKPVLGSEAKIMARKNDEGSIYFATDTGKIFLDADDQRINMGGAGAAIYYGKTVPTSYVDSKGNVVEGNPSSDSEETEKAQYWIIEKTTLMNNTDNPVINDIILTIQDGTFYKVEKIQDSNFYCQRLSISGGGTIGPVQKI